MKLLLTSLLIAISFVSSTSVAEDLSDVVRRSKVIAVINITAGTIQPREEIDNGCGYAYDAFVGTGIKNAREGERLSFRADLPLVLSGTYLVFLTDTVANQPGESMSKRAQISSAKCARSGVTLTPVEFLQNDSMVGGPELIFERWLLQVASNSNNGGGIEHFLGSRRLEDLFRYGCPDEENVLSPIIIEIQRPHFTSKKIAYNAASLLGLLASMN